MGPVVPVSAAWMSSVGIFLPSLGVTRGTSQSLYWFGSLLNNPEQLQEGFSGQVLKFLLDGP